MNDADTDSLAEIRAGLALFFREGDGVEMRVPRKKDVPYCANVSGFFTNQDKLARAIQQINQRKQTVFVTMNPLQKSDWIIFNNKAYVGAKPLRQELEKAGLPFEPRMKATTDRETGETHWGMRMADDEDVLSRRWILIDIDAGQPADTNSTNAEHNDTLTTAKDVIAFLKDHGFPVPALTNSGNGHHVYVRVDLPNDSRSELLVSRFLKALAQKFDGSHGTAKVDVATYNAARITKAIGTMVYKGEHSEERPQRRSTVLQLPSPRFALEEQLVEIAGEAAGETEREEIAHIDDAELDAHVTKLKEFLDFYGIEHHGALQSGDHITILCTCPNAENHTMDGGERETVATVHLSGPLGFCCQHAHCQELRGWQNFKRYMERTTGKTFAWSPVLTF